MINQIVRDEKCVESLAVGGKLFAERYLAEKYLYEKI